MNITIGEYDELIMSFLRGDCTEEEACFVSSSVAGSSENQAYFEAIKRVWELTDFPQPKVDVEAALQLVNEQIDSMKQETAQPIRVSWLKRNLKQVSNGSCGVGSSFHCGFLFTRASRFTHVVTIFNPMELGQAFCAARWFFRDV